MIICWANTLVAATCIGNAPGEAANAKKVRDISDWLGKVGFLLGLHVGVTKTAIDARMRLAVDDIKRAVPNCYNMSILTLQYRNSCEQLVTNPAGRVRQIMCKKDKSAC